MYYRNDETCVKALDCSHKPSMSQIALLIAVHAFHVEGSSTAVIPSISKPLDRPALAPATTYSQPTKASNSLLSLRGGASIGPITPSVAVKIYMFAFAYYTVELFGYLPMTPDPVLKYFGTPSNALTRTICQWFGFALAVHGSSVAYFHLKAGLDAVAVSKFATVYFLTIILVNLFYYKQGLAVVTECPAVCGLFALLFGYIGFK